MSTQISCNRDIVTKKRRFSIRTEGKDEKKEAMSTQRSVCERNGCQSNITADIILA
jgi:hypothetical protein